MLEPFQRDFLVRLYLRWPNGVRRYRRALYGVGKGNGKTPIAAWVGDYELLGTKKTAPRVVCGAASLEQANLVFGDLKAAATGPPDNPSPLRPYVIPYELEVQLKGRAGVAQRIAAVAGTNDGARATVFIADELHEWEGRTARVYMIVEGAVAKREDGFTLAISTAGVIGSDSPLEPLYEYGVKVATGQVADPEFLFVWYEPHRDYDLDNPRQWDRAVREANPAVGVFNDVENIRRRFRTMPRFEWERYHLNRWTASKQRWIDMAVWDRCGGKVDIPEGPDTEVTVGIDAASKFDHTAIWLAWTDPDGNIQVQGEEFVAPEGEVIDPELIRNRLRHVDRTFYVKRFRYDPHLFWESAQALAEEGLAMEEVPQTIPRQIDYSRAIYDVVNQRRLIHDGDPNLRRAADSAVAKDRGNGFTLDKLKASRHIDSLVACAMAVEGELLDDVSGPGIQVIDAEEEE